MLHDPEYEEDNVRCRYCGKLWRPSMDTDGSNCRGAELALWAASDPDFIINQGEDNPT